MVLLEEVVPVVVADEIGPPGWVETDTLDVDEPELVETESIGPPG